MYSLAVGCGNEMLMGKKPIARSLRVETFPYLREILSHCDLVRKVRLEVFLVRQPGTVSQIEITGPPHVPIQTLRGGKQAAYRGNSPGIAMRLPLDAGITRRTNRVLATR
jgi:hypothetical protein